MAKVKSWCPKTTTIRVFIPLYFRKKIWKSRKKWMTPLLRVFWGARAIWNSARGNDQSARFVYHGAPTPCKFSCLNENEWRARAENNRAPAPYEMACSPPSHSNDSLKWSRSVGSLSNLAFHNLSPLHWKYMQERGNQSKVQNGELIGGKRPKSRNLS